MATETSSTDITDRFFTFLIDYDFGTQYCRLQSRGRSRPTASRGRSILGKAPVFRRSSNHGGRRAVHFEVVYDESLHPPLPGVAAGRRAELQSHGAGQVHDRHQHGKAACGLARCALSGQSSRSCRSTCSSTAFRDGQLRSRPTTSAHRQTKIDDERRMAGQRNMRRTKRPCSYSNPYYYAFDQNNQRGCHTSTSSSISSDPDQDAADLLFRSGGADKRRRCEAGKLPVVPEKTGSPGISHCTISAPTQNTHLNVVQPEQGPAAGSRHQAVFTESASASHL